MWKQRLYAFLLRRVLGQILTERSSKNLSENISCCSLQEGKFIFSDLEFQPEYITQSLLLLPSNVKVTHCSVSKLQVTLTLLTSDANRIASDNTNGIVNETSTTGTNFLWNLANNKVALKVQLDLSGILVEVSLQSEDKTKQSQEKKEKCPPDSPQRTTTTAATTTVDTDYGTTSANSGNDFWISCVDAVISSLRVTVKNVTLSFGMENENPTDHPMRLSLTLQSATYYDNTAIITKNATTGTNTTNIATAKQQLKEPASDIIMHKIIDFSSFSITVSSSSSLSAESKVVSADGNAQVNLRVFRNSHTGIIFHDISVAIHQQWQVIPFDYSLIGGIPPNNAFHRYQQQEQQPFLIFIQRLSYVFSSISNDCNSRLTPTTMAVNTEKDTAKHSRTSSIYPPTTNTFDQFYTEARKSVEQNEVKGGILIPSNSAGSTVEYDAFFDCTDRSFSVYLSLVRPDAHDKFTSSTRIHFHLTEVTVLIPTCCFITLGDLSMTGSISDLESIYAIEIGHLAWDTISTGTHNSMIRFIEEVEERMVTIPPCLSWNYRISKLTKSGPSSCNSSTNSDDVFSFKATESQMEITLLPVEVTFSQAVIQNELTTLVHVVSLIKEYFITSSSSTSQTQANLIPGSRQNFKCSIPSLHCSYQIPMDSNASLLVSRGASLIPSHGASYHSPRKGTALVGLELKCIHLEYLDKNPLRPSTWNRNNGARFREITVEFDSLSVFAEGSVACNTPKQMTFFKLLGGGGIDNSAPSTTVEICYKRNVCKGEKNSLVNDVHHFPHCHPISMTKPRQQSASTFNQKGSSYYASVADTMLERARQCDDIFQLSIPQLIVDINLYERNCLLQILSEISLPTSPSSLSARDDDDEFQTSLLACNIMLHRSILWLHNEEASSLLAVLDNCNFHFVKSAKFGIMQCRILTNDFTLYEGKQICSRRTSLHGNEANPILFRSKIGKPLSPTTPAVHIDWLITRDEAEIALGESEICINLYDISHRLDIVDSQWLLTLFAVVSLGTKKDDCSVTGTQTADSVTKLFISITDCNVDYSSPPIFNRAVRAVGRIGEMDLSCNIVSGSPSQSIKISLGNFSFYLSNLRFSHTSENAQLLCSNVLKIAKGNENSSMTPLVDCKYCAFEDVLGAMGFVSMITLDSADMLVIKMVDEKTRRQRKKGANMPPAKLTFDVTLGQMNLYACKDSFNCLTDLFGDVSLHFAKLAENGQSIHEPCDEANNLQVESKSKSRSLTDTTEVLRSNARFDSARVVDSDTARNDALEAKLSCAENLASIPDSELSAKELRQKHNIIDDDDVAMRLARALLIKNYYTVETQSLAKVNQSKNEQTRDSKNISGKILTANDIIVAVQDGLLLDGYDWTEVDYCGWSRIPSEVGQQTEWFPATEIQIFPNHISIDPVRDPLADGNMNSIQLAGTKESPPVEFRIFIRDLSSNCRFFTGMDWENKKRNKFSEPSKQSATGSAKRKDQILGTLLEGFDEDEAELFSKHLKSEGRTHTTRQVNSYFELSVAGVQMRMDAYTPSENHRLLSTLDLNVMDFFLSESISSESPTKLLFEWLSVEKHPRDTDDGMLMMKMVSFHPVNRISSYGNIKNDESRVTLQILPLRCHLDQHVLRSIQDFFSFSAGVTDSNATGENSNDPSKMNQSNVEAFFETFLVKACKLKVNYRPIGVDATALREGSYVELLNLFSLENVELILKSVEMKGVYGWGAVFSDVFRRYVEDICNTQLHKFLGGAAPLNPISNLSGGVADLVLIPMLHYKKDRNLSRGIRKATTHFASTVTLEALNTTSKLTKTVARTLSKATATLPQQKRTLSLPARPDRVPRSIGDTAHHAYESISRGLKASNYMIVVVPRREYKKSGTKGAVKSVVRGIPIAILAPISGASEALSYTLVGIRNQLNPEVRKEEEVRLSGLRR